MKQLVLLVLVLLLSAPAVAGSGSEPLTRAVLAQLMLETLPFAAQLPDRNTAGPFSDITPAHPNYRAIATLTRKGLMEGYPDGTFKPQRILTRYDLAAVMANLARWFEGHYGQELPLVAGKPQFTDLAMSHWAYKSVVEAVRRGVLTGFHDGTFRGTQQASVAETADYLNAFRRTQVALQNQREQRNTPYHTATPQPVPSARYSPPPLSVFEQLRDMVAQPSRPVPSPQWTPRPSPTAAVVTTQAAPSPSSPALAFQRGFALLKANQYEAALREFREVARLLPRDADARAGAGMCLFYLRRYGEAEVEFREEARLEPESYGAHRWLALVLKRLGRDAEAKREEQLGLALHLQKIYGAPEDEFDELP